MKSNKAHKWNPETGARQLAINAMALAERNIGVRVLRVNAGRTVAFCTVQQRQHGLWWRTASSTELLAHAENALAPLVGFGLFPIITMQPGDQRRPASRAHAPYAWLQRLLGWLGAVGLREGIETPVDPADPFGLQRALLLPAPKPC